MTREEFDNVVTQTTQNCLNTLTVKGKEYQRNNNPLHNFDRGVEVSGFTSTREEIIWGMALKHFISVQDIKDDLANHILPTKELIDEKYGDLINYLLIEKASIVDKINESDNLNFRN